MPALVWAASAWPSFILVTGMDDPALKDEVYPRYPHRDQLFFYLQLTDAGCSNPEAVNESEGAGTQ